LAQNVNYANDDLILESLVVHTLPDFGPHGDGIINQNMLLSYLKDGKRMRTIDGGLEFWRPLMKAENSNFKWQSHTADKLLSLLVVRLVEKAIKFRETLTVRLMAILSETLTGTCRDYNIAFSCEKMG